MFDLSSNDLNRIKQRVDTTEGGAEVGFQELVVDPVIEGFLASPTAQAVSYVTSGAMDTPSLMAEEANSMYGLEGTPVAFEPGTPVSAKHAKYVANQWADRQAAELQKQMLDDKYSGFVTGVSSFVGNLVGGMADPTNIALGIGTGAAMSRMGFYSIEQVSKAVTVQAAKQASKQAMMKAVGGAALENLVVNTATEFSFGKLQEYATNQEISTKDRVIGILAGTVLGTAMQGGMAVRNIGRESSKRIADLTPTLQADGQTTMAAIGAPENIRYSDYLDNQTKRLVKRETVKASQIVEEYGDVGEQMIFDLEDHMIKSEANMVVFNPDYVKNRTDIELYETRSHQTPYVFNQLDDMSIAGTPFYRASEGDGLSSSFGVGFSDNPNFINNSRARHGVKPSKKETIDTFDMSESAILDMVTFNKNKVAVVSKDGTTVMESAYGIAFKDDLELQLKSNGLELPREVSDMLDLNSQMSDDIKELIDGVRVIMAESDLDVDVDGIMANVLKKAGFDGVHFVSNKGTPNAHNTLFMLNAKKPKKVASDPIKAFDDQLDTHVAAKLKELELKEFGRFQDPTQKVDYNKAVDVEAQKIVPATVDEDAAVIDSLLAELGITRDFDLEAPKVDADGKPQVLDELDGIKQSLEANDHESTIKMLASCIYKSKG